jgi:branched-chain amino acid aminotransferase
MATAWHNGFWVEDTTQAFNLNHRITRYGDGLFETILVLRHQPLWIEEHFERLSASALLLGLILPADFSLLAFGNTIQQLCEKNDAQDQRVRVVVYRNGSGTYLPTSNYAGVFITTQALNFNPVCAVLPNVGFYERIQKPMNLLSPLKSSNALLFVLASTEAQERKLDDVILLNTEDRVCEATSSNVFVIKDGKLFTPPIAEGCVDGVLRKVLLHNFSVEEMPITKPFLLSSDSVFTTNTIQGIRAVQRIDAKVFSVAPVAALHENYIQLLSKHIGKPLV